MSTVTIVFEVFGVPKNITPTKSEWTLMYKKMKQRYHPDKYNTKDSDEIALFTDFYNLISKIHTIGLKLSNDDVSMHDRSWTIPDYVNNIIDWDFEGTPLDDFVESLKQQLNDSGHTFNDKGYVDDGAIFEHATQQERDNNNYEAQKEQRRAKRNQIVIHVTTLVMRVLFNILYFVLWTLFFGHTMRRVWLTIVVIMIFMIPMVES